MRDAVSIFGSKAVVDAPGRPAESAPWPFIASCVALGGALRFATLDLQSFDHDESVSVGRILDGNLADVFSDLPQSERTPPLYYTLAWLWTRVFGTGEVGARSFSAALGTATILIAFLGMRRLFGERVGLAGAALVAVNPLLVWNSQDARSYALGVLLVTGAVWAFAAALDRPTARNRVTFAVVAALAGATHYFTWFVIAPMAGWLAWRCRGIRAKAELLVPLALVAAALAVLAYEQAVNKGDRGFEQGGIARRLAVTVAQFTVGENPPVPSGDGVDLAFRGAGVLVVILAATGFVLGMRSRWRPEVTRVMAATGLAGVVIPACLALAGIDFYNGRNVMFALVPLISVMAVGFAAPLGNGSRLRYAALAAMLVIQVGVVIAVTQEAGLQRPDWRSASAAIEDLQPGDAVLAARSSDDALAFYLGARDAGESPIQATRVFVVSGPFDEDQVPEVVEAPPDGYRLARQTDLEGIHIYVLRTKAARPPAINWGPQSASAVLVAPAA